MRQPAICRYAWCKTLPPYCFGHVGEIQALKARRALVAQEA
jgi:hypothetical protein